MMLNKHSAQLNIKPLHLQDWVVILFLAFIHCKADKRCTTIKSSSRGFLFDNTSNSRRSKQRNDQELELCCQIMQSSPEKKNLQTKQRRPRLQRNLSYSQN